MKYFSIILIAIIMCSELEAQNLEVEGEVIITEMDTVSNISGTLTRLNNGTLVERQYRVGDIAHGGIVFYIDETGQHGLVADTNDLSSSMRWYAGTLIRTRAVGNGVFAGAMNTAIIIATQAMQDDGDDYAAFICSALEKGGFGDWYLPSAGELELMDTNLHSLDLGQFANSFYWSSTENSLNTALIRGFATHTTNFSVKSGAYHVRAIRSF